MTVSENRILLRLGGEALNNQNTKINTKSARIGESILFGTAFICTLAVMLLSTNTTNVEGYFGASFALSFVFTVLAGKEYLYKMPATISLAIIIALIILQRLTLPYAMSIIAGAIMCILFLWIEIKFNPTKHENCIRT